MLNKLESKNYSLYTFEEFLQDNFFISSIKNPTEETIRFWKEFQESNPSNIEEFLSACQYLSVMGEDDCMPDKDVADLWDRISETKANKKKNRRRLLYTGISAAACIAIFFSIFPALRNSIGKDMDIAAYAEQAQYSVEESGDTKLILSDEKIVLLDTKESEIKYDSTKINTGKEDIAKDNIASYNQLITPKGKRSVLTFSDGTKMWVNAGSRVIYPAEFQKDKREIYVDGEVFIEAAHDANRPFIVRTKGVDVKVLGTKFNVMAYESDNSSKVVLVSGSVQVNTKHTPKAVLTPSQMFSLANGKESITHVDTEKHTSWVYGLYIFESEELGSVFKRLSTYYGIPIDCDASVSKLKCSGKLDLKDNLESVLKGLTFVAPVSYDLQNGKYNIIKK